LLARLLSERIARYREASRAASGQMAGYLTEMLGGVQALKLACAEGPAAEEFAARCEGRRHAELRDKLASEVAFGSVESLTQLVGGVVLLVAAPALAAGSFSIGDLALFIAYLDPLTDSVNFFTHLVVVYRQADVSMARLTTLLPEGEEVSLVARTDTHMDGRFPAITAPERRPEQALRVLEVRGLTSHHGGTGHGIEDVSFRLEAGTLTVVTGRVGSGKSTLLRALLGLLPLDSGEVLWNGKPLADRGAFLQPPRAAYVPQAPLLFSETLRANVLLGLTEDDEALSRALRLAALEEDVPALERGLDTTIGPRGVKLSGGQQQRVAAARAFLRSPDLLVLDDLSSALDVETERRLWQRLLEDGARRGQTFLVVSHRRAVLERADRVLILSEGKLKQMRQRKAQPRSSP
jgi:ABC-type multidrug transport system fused ATPase/permease subunit